MVKLVDVVVYETNDWVLPQTVELEHHSQGYRWRPVVTICTRKSRGKWLVTYRATGLTWLGDRRLTRSEIGELKRMLPGQAIAREIQMHPSSLRGEVHLSSEEETNALASRLATWFENRLINDFWSRIPRAS